MMGMAPTTTGQPLRPLMVTMIMTMTMTMTMVVVNSMQLDLQAKRFTATASSAERLYLQCLVQGSWSPRTLET